MVPPLRGALANFKRRFTIAHKVGLNRQMKCVNGWRVLAALNKLPLVAIMCCSLVLQPSYGQQGEARIGLKIMVVEGANARNVTQEIPVTALTVRVVTANNEPVPNATVVFNSPATGPSGEFANDARSFSVTTNGEGLATARGYHPNSITGTYSIQVRATWQGETAIADITQRNVAPGQGGLGKRIAIIAIAGAAAGAVIAARGRSSSNTSGAPTITFGGGAVGAPR